MHPKPLSEIQRAAARALLFEICEAHRSIDPGEKGDNLSTDAGVVKALSDYFASVPRPADVEHHEYAQFYFDSSVISRLRNNKVKTTEKVIWAIYLYLRSKYGKRLLEKIIEERMVKRGNLISEMRKALGYTPNINVDDVESLKGVFNIFRTAFWYPYSDIMMSTLEIGQEDGRPFACVMRSKIPTSDQFDTFEGQVVPHEKKLIVVLTAQMDGPQNIILHFDRKAVGSGAVSSMSGIALTSVGSDPASAWPIHAVRTSDEASPEILAWDDIPKKVDRAFDAHEVQKTLRRGYVHWDFSQLPPRP